MISFDSCRRYDCWRADERYKRGPLQYRIIAAKDCSSSSFRSQDWRPLDSTFYKRDGWRDEKPAKHELYVDEAFKCYGIEILDISSSKKGPIVADIKFWTLRCDKYNEVVDGVKGWDCDGDLLGAKCLAQCDGGKSPYGAAVCRRDKNGRNGRFSIQGKPGDAHLDGPK